MPSSVALLRGVVAVPRIRLSDTLRFRHPSDRHFLSVGSSNKCSSLSISGPAPFSKSRVVFASKFDFFKTALNLWQASKDVVDTGTSFVPEVVPRPAARIIVIIGSFAIVRFFLGSLVSTVFFVAGTMLLAYFAYLAMNKGRDTKTTKEDKPMEDPVEEAARIMNKYK